MNDQRILVVDDEEDILSLLNEILKEEGFQVETARNAEQARQLREAHHHDLILLDIWLPDSDGITLLREWSGRHRCPVIMISGHASIDVALEASRWGAVDVLEKPISLRKLLSAVNRALTSEFRSSPPPSPPPLLLDTSWGKSPALLELRHAINALLQSPVDTLLVGEFGSGREEIAHRLHEGVRPQGPFVRCTPTRLHEKESFFECVHTASGGTLFLTRLEGLQPSIQQQIVDWLESRPVSHEAALLIARVGVDLGSWIERSDLTRDLVILLGRRIVHVPSIREYRDDIPELVGMLSERLSTNLSLPYRRFTVPALNLLRQQDWPGNLRQLTSVVETVLQETAQSAQEVIEPNFVQSVLSRDPMSLLPPVTILGQDWLQLPLREARERFERLYFEYLMRRYEGKIGRVAEASGMERTHLYRKLRSLGISRETSWADEG